MQARLIAAVATAVLATSFAPSIAPPTRRQQRRPAYHIEGSGPGARPSDPDMWNTYHRTHAELLHYSLLKHTGQVLLDDADDYGDFSATALACRTDAVILSHGTEESPLLNYGTRAALNLLDCEWDEFVSLEWSDCLLASAATDLRAVAAAVDEDGYKDGIALECVSTYGQRFVVRDALAWRVDLEDGTPAGRALMFKMGDIIGDPSKMDAL